MTATILKTKGFGMYNRFLQDERECALAGKPLSADNKDETLRKIIETMIQEYSTLDGETFLEIDKLKEENEKLQEEITKLKLNLKVARERCDRWSTDEYNRGYKEATIEASKDHKKFNEIWKTECITEQDIIDMKHQISEQCDMIKTLKKVDKALYEENKTLTNKLETKVKNVDMRCGAFDVTTNLSYIYGLMEGCNINTDTIDFDEEKQTKFDFACEEIAGAIDGAINMNERGCHMCLSNHIQSEANEKISELVDMGILKEIEKDE